MVLLELAALGALGGTRKGRKISKKIIQFPGKALNKEREFLGNQFDLKGKRFKELMVG